MPRLHLRSGYRGRLTSTTSEERRRKRQFIKRTKKRRRTEEGTARFPRLPPPPRLLGSAVPTLKTRSVLLHRRPKSLRLCREARKTRIERRHSRKRFMKSPPLPPSHPFVAGGVAEKAKKDTLFKGSPALEASRKRDQEDQEDDDEEEDKNRDERHRETYFTRAV